MYAVRDQKYAILIGEDGFGGDDVCHYAGGRSLKQAWTGRGDGMRMDIFKLWSGSG
jgi:hypothetical protein